MSTVMSVARGPGYFTVCEFGDNHCQGIIPSAGGLLPDHKTHADSYETGSGNGGQKRAGGQVGKKERQAFPQLQEAGKA